MLAGQRRAAGKNPYRGSRAVTQTKEMNPIMITGYHIALYSVGDMKMYGQGK